MFTQTSNNRKAEQFEEGDEAIERAKEMAAKSGAHYVFHIWTVVDGEGNSLIVQNGWHLCNRMFYIVTEKPWNPGSNNKSKKEGEDYLHEYIEAEY